MGTAFIGGGGGTRKKGKNGKNLKTLVPRDCIPPQGYPYPVSSGPYLCTYVWIERKSVRKLLSKETIRHNAEP